MEAKQTIVLGGGCFWCTEAVFKMLKGIISIEPGYAGGTTKHPTYEQVCGGATGHAEVIKVTYDHNIIPLETLLTVFFATHDPTTLNRQGNDSGTQYRSIVLYTNPEQKTEAEKFIEDLKQSDVAVVTEVNPLDKFYLAEANHQDFYQNNSAQPYCQLVINPKLVKMQEKFQVLLK